MVSLIIDKKVINKGGTAIYSPLDCITFFKLGGKTLPNLLEPLIVFILVLIIIFIIDYQINKNKLYLIEHKGLSKQNKKKKIKQIGEIDYLTHKFKLQDKTLYTKRVIFWISIINAFIISFTSTIITLIPLNMIFQLLIAFVLLFALIYSLYEIYGRHLKNIEDKTLIKEKNNISKTKSIHMTNIISCSNW